MSQENKRRQIILNNILFLAQKSLKQQSSQRNVLNKWFQDAIKSYILESIASPLIADPLKLHSSIEVKNFICKQANKNKAKYMAIIDQYFFYIKQYNKNDLFVKKLKQIIYSPLDITQQKGELSYMTQKIVRKQFVSFLILKYFELHQQQEIPSFYELWNTCFPQQIQTKKKLSKYDKKVEKKETKRQYKKKLYQNDFSCASTNIINEGSSHSLGSQQTFLIQETNTEISSFQDHISLEQSQIKLPQDYENNYKSSIYLSNNQINNRIFEDESCEIDCMSCFLEYNNNNNQQQKELQLSSQCDFEASEYEYQRDQQIMSQLYQNEEYNSHYNYNLPQQNNDEQDIYNKQNNLKIVNEENVNYQFQFSYHQF